jgi:hypothetical protein
MLMSCRVFLLGVLVALLFVCAPCMAAEKSKCEKAKGVRDACAATQTECKDDDSYCTWFECVATDQPKGQEYVDVNCIDGGTFDDCVEWEKQFHGQERDYSFSRRTVDFRCTGEEKPSGGGFEFEDWMIGAAGVLVVAVVAFVCWRRSKTSNDYGAQGMLDQEYEPVI